MASKPPRWARHQIVAAYITGLAGVAMFVAEAIAPLAWGARLDFGELPFALLIIAGYVLFHLKLPVWFGRDDNGKDSP